MMNYLLSQGQWKVIANKFPAPEYEFTTTVTMKDAEGTHTETVPDTSKPARNQSEIDSWFDTNDRALGNIMLRLHPTLATTVLNLLEKTIAENTNVNTMFASIAWEYLEATYGKPGITATYKELKTTMEVIIPGNADPTLAIDTILIGFTRMAASKCAVVRAATGPGRRTSRQSKRGGVYPCCEVFQRRTEDEGENATRARRG